MKFVDIKGTVARSLGRANCSYLCLGLDLENADILFQDINTLDAINFVLKHAVSCSRFTGRLNNNSLPDQHISLIHNIDIFRCRGSVPHVNYPTKRVVVSKDIVCTGVLDNPNILSFLSFYSSQGTQFTFKVDGSASIDFDFGQATNITTFEVATSKSRVESTLTLKLYLKGVEVLSTPLSNSNNLLVNKRADSAKILMESNSQLVSNCVINAPRFFTEERIEIVEDVKSVLFMRFDPVFSNTWSNQPPIAHYTLDDVELCSNETGLLVSTFPMMLGLEAL